VGFLVNEKRAVDLKNLVDSLNELHSWLDKRFGRKKDFTRTSASQTDSAYAKFKAGAPPTEADFFSTVYAASLHVRQFEALIFIVSLVVRNTIQSIDNAFKRNDLTTILNQLRFLLERFSHLYFVRTRIDAIRSA
jgi:hypothetical protein